MTLTLLTPGRIGPVETRNRIVRSSTSETLADDRGFVTPAYRDFHLRLARNGVGLIFTGHVGVHPTGKYIRGMTMMDDDAHVEVLQPFTDAIHAEGARIFMQLQHAGSQSRVPELTPLAPSVVPNPQFFRTPREMTEDDIHTVIGAFGAAAGRVKAAGFDGCHVHAGHGYLISEFLSPVSNRREDAWGGSLENRARFGLEAFRAMRKAVGPDFPISWKLGLQDYVPGGLALEDGLAVAELLDREGVDALEGSAGLMTPQAESAPRYAGVSRLRALEDLLLHRVLPEPIADAYYVGNARRLRARVGCAVICVGGLRDVDTMEAVVRDGVADFVSLARPFIRQPDLVRRIEAGERWQATCVSCNICLMHEGLHGLQCWRTPKTELLRHAYFRLAGKLAP